MKEFLWGDSILFYERVVDRNSVRIYIRLIIVNELVILIQLQSMKNVSALGSIMFHEKCLEQ